MAHARFHMPLSVVEGRSRPLLSLLVNT
jgi:hypothetical protein